MAQKTQAMRVLEGQGIHYSSMTYDKSERDALLIAAEIGVRPEKVFKTLTRKPTMLLTMMLTKGGMTARTLLSS